MIAFAKEDPLYRELMGALLPIIKSDPGILQSQIYSKVIGFNEDEIRYALYFAQELQDITRIKKGRSYQLFGPTESIILKPGDKMDQTILVGQIEIQKNPVKEKIRTLQKDASTESDSGLAIAYLQEASELMRNSQFYNIDKMLKLPVLLHETGRFDEAMQEFERLLNEAKSVAERDEQSKTLPTFVRYTTHAFYQSIYKKMRMVCKKQKLKDKEAEYRSLAEKHKLVADELSKLVQFERNKAYSADRLKQLKDPGLLKVMPYWRYVSNRTMVSPCHLEWDGLVLAHDDPWWDAHFPPNDINCRCRVTGATKTEYKGDIAPG
jgi:SPP1 gp7 family putative phage head morphogenesis protein